MTTESHSMTSSTDTITAETTPRDANAELRAHADRLSDENKALRSEIVGMRLAGIGLDPNEGLGKAIAKEYDGETSQEAIASYAASEYNYGTDGAIPPEVVSDGADRIADVMDDAAPDVPDPTPDPAVEAEARLIQPDAGRDEAQASLATKLNAYRESNR